MDRVLLLSSVDDSPSAGGRAMLSRTNLLLLRELLGARLSHCRPARLSPSWRDGWRGHVDGIDDAFIAALIARIEAERIGQLFVDGSNYGAAVAAVKKRTPEVRVITFFHNVEARFFWGSLRARRSGKALGVLLANYLAERAAARWSDALVTLSERDSLLLYRMYGRSADAITPIVLEDKAAEEPGAAASRIGERYLLFVGGGFYANIAGIRWFARAVAPRIHLPICVLGRGMETLASEFAKNGNITVVGEVGELAPWYVGATAVIAPIFDGSGMKTKVAEALMFGKRIAGTPEAFSGYSDDVVCANWMCHDADDFVAAIGTLQATQSRVWDARLRNLYERDHSPAAARTRLAAILGLHAGSQARDGDS